MSDVAADGVLTDEELEGYEAVLVPPRLIAACRDLRSEVERLSEQNYGLYLAALALGREVDRHKTEIARLRQDAAENYERAERAEAALVACRAEVARLRASLVINDDGSVGAAT